MCFKPKRKACLGVWEKSFKIKTGESKEHSDFKILTIAEAGERHLGPLIYLLLCIPQAFHNRKG